MKEKYSIEQLFAGYGGIKDFLENYRSEEKRMQDLEYLRAEHYICDDMKMGHLFSQYYFNIIRYNVSVKSYFVYDGKCWKQDTENLLAEECLKNLVEDLIKYSKVLHRKVLEGTFQEDKLNLYKQELSRYGRHSVRASVIADGKTELRVESTDFDQNANLFNTQNGIVDLETGELLPHSPKYMITHCSPVSYYPEARCERWEQFIREIGDDNEEWAEYVQRVCGYIFVSPNTDKMFFILYGPKANNGKSTLMSSINHLLGDYSMTVPSSFIAEGKNDSPNADKASPVTVQLKGKLLAYMEELKERSVMNGSFVKDMSGNNTIQCRPLYGNPIQYKPWFKMFLATNHLPRVYDQSVFESKRVVVIPFNRVFLQNADVNLQELFCSDEAMSGILNWMIEGLKRYRSGIRQNLKFDRPAIIEESTETYIRLSDRILCFFDECLQKSDNPKANLAISDVYPVYNAWCLKNNYMSESVISFNKKLREKGLFADRGTIGGRTVRNVIPGYDFNKEQFKEGSKYFTEIEKQ